MILQNIYITHYHGDTLDDLLERSKSKFNFYTIIHLFLEILIELESLHRKGISHRDLKPSNILIDVSGNLWLIDRGVSNDVCVWVALKESMNGTPSFSAPECFPTDHTRARFVKSLKPPVDIYSSAIIFYTLITGKKPVFIPPNLRMEDFIPESLFLKNIQRQMEDLQKNIKTLLGQAIRERFPYQSIDLKKLLEEVEKILDTDSNNRPTAQELIEKLLPYTDIPAIADMIIAEHNNFKIKLFFVLLSYIPKI